MNNEFSVIQFFADGTWERFMEWVNAEVATNGFARLIGTVGAKLGTTKRIIITDGGDCICAEWIYGKGITFPTKEDVEKARNNGGQ